MTVQSFAYIQRVIQEKGLGYVAEVGFKYYSAYFVHFVLAPVYYFKLKALPASLSIQKTLAFVNQECQGAFKPLQIESEITQLLKHVKKLKPKVVVEIGSANGGTLFSMIKQSPSDTTFVSIDLPGGTFGGGYAWYKIFLFKAFVKAQQSIHLLRSDSHAQSTKDELVEVLAGRKVDFLFIDGDHTYEGVKQDYELYSPLVKKGGWIGFHDIVHHRSELQCEVDIFWKEVKKKRQFVEFVEDWEQGLCGIGLIKVR